MLGLWQGEATLLQTGDSIRQVLESLQNTVFVVENSTGAVAATCKGMASCGDELPELAGNPLLALLPPITASSLGDSHFRQQHQLKYAYVGGAMANGIASVELVEALAKAGMLGIFGAAGLSIAEVDRALLRLQKNLGQSKCYGVNLIHSPNETTLEMELVDLFIKRNLSLIEASAYLDLSLAVVRYSLHNIHRDASGKIVRPHRVIAKVSRVEVARKFMAPAPEKFLSQLIERGDLTLEQAELARQVPIAQDLTAEADSGGHTDNRPALALLPTLLTLRDQLQTKYNFAQPLRVGAAGGISTPASAAAAFTMGAAYIVLGSIHQACQESGSCDEVRNMLASAEQADVAMAPAADMFEMGVKVQVLKRGTLFAMRAQKLYDLYKSYSSWGQIPERDQSTVENQLFQQSFDQVWQSCVDFFSRRDPKQLERAERDPRHQMALVFRWYLGSSSGWANRGDVNRKVDYQVWCGPAMGAFNEWTRGSFLEQVPARKVATVALNMMIGAALATRFALLRSQGIEFNAPLLNIGPLTDSEMKPMLGTTD